MGLILETLNGFVAVAGCENVVYRLENHAQRFPGTYFIINDQNGSLVGHLISLLTA